MREVVHTSQFKRDYRKRSRERGIDALLTTVIENLLVGRALEAKFGIIRSKAPNRENAVQQKKQLTRMCPASSPNPAEYHTPYDERFENL